MKHLFISIMFFTGLTVSAQQFPCSNGQALFYPCKDIDLLSIVSPSDLQSDPLIQYAISDLWGWTDESTGKEYAIVGMINGTSFVDVTDPVNPVVLGYLLAEGDVARPTPFQKPAHGYENSIWKDIKTYNNHAFIVSEANEFGMQVFDLTKLRNVPNPPELFTSDAHYEGISNAHNIVINPSKGIAYIVGANNGGGLTGLSCQEGGLHVVNISDPLNPTFKGCHDIDGYIHDSQCITYDGPDLDYSGQEICFNSNEDSLLITDVTNINDIKRVGLASYDSVRYFHQGWLTEDRRFFLSNDENDENVDQHNTRTYIFNVEDLDHPTYIGFIEAETEAVDHNLYIKGNLVYQSNYAAGLRIRYLENPGNLELPEVAFFDTYPTSNTRGSSGSWSNYPYFESGNILISDFESGLFIVRARPTIDDIQEDLKERVDIYPNPVNTRLNIDIDFPSEVHSLEVFNATGKLVIQTTDFNPTLDISTLITGLYFLRIEYTDGTHLEHPFTKL